MIKIDFMKDGLMKKIDFVFHVAVVKRANPNGDPDADNMPRMFMQDGDTYGFMTSGCIGHKIRMRMESMGSKIWVSPSSGLLVKDINRLYGQVRKDDKKDKRAERDEFVNRMTAEFADIRIFGGVLSIGEAKNTGASVHGPITICDLESIHPISSDSVTITRCVATKDTVSQNTSSEQSTETGKMGTKHQLPFAIYKGCGTLCPNWAIKSGLTASDVEMFFEALGTMFEGDQSAARPGGSMVVIDLHVFVQDDKKNGKQSFILHNAVNLIQKDLSKQPTKLEDFVLEKVKTFNGISYTYENYLE
jgi:CRISPR-associated protein Csd2